MLNNFKSNFRSDQETYPLFSDVETRNVEMASASAQEATLHVARRLYVNLSFAIG
jgi:hypothetical protein